MAKLIDPDDLIVSSTVGQLGVDGNIWLDTSAKTFTLAAYSVLVAKDGVTGNALWAKLVDLWTTSTYQPYPFPMNVLDARSGQYIFGQDPGGTYNGWKPANDATRQMIRDAGWSEYSIAGVLNRQYVGMVALASGYPNGAQFYYQKVSAGAAANFTYTDAPNEAIQVYGIAGEPSAFDSRAYFKLYCRAYQYQYDDAVLGDVGESTTGAFKVSLPISVSSDLDITANDAAMSSGVYPSIKIRYFSQAFTRTIESVTGRNFGIVIDVGTFSGVDGSAPGGASVLTTASGDMTINAYTGGVLTIYEGTDAGVSFPIVSNTATTITVTGTLAVGSNLSFTAQLASPVSASLQQIYTKIQYQLRQTGNINAVAGGTTVNGTIAALLLNFVGSSLKCGFYTPTNPAGGGTGVLIQGLQAADVNSIVFYDNIGATREYLYTSTGTLNFNAALTSGSTGYYRMYFANDDYGDNSGDDYGTATAITVNDASGNPITGTISGSSIAFTYDYDGNSQRGNTPPASSPAGDASVVIVAGNAGSAKPVVATGTLTRSKGIAITLTAETDRAYLV